MAIDEETREKLNELVDLLESKYGNLEGFEVKLSHPVNDGGRQEYATIDEFVVYYLYKQNLLE